MPPYYISTVKKVKNNINSTTIKHLQILSKRHPHPPHTHLRFNKGIVGCGVGFKHVSCFVISIFISFHSFQRSHKRRPAHTTQNQFLIFNGCQIYPVSIFLYIFILRFCLNRRWDFEVEMVKYMRVLLLITGHNE